VNPLDKFRYMDARDRRKLFAVAGLFVAATLVTSTLVVTRCNRAVDVNTGRLDSAEQAALAQVREAFFAVQTALVGESPAPTVADAVRRVASEKGAATLKSAVDQSPLKFNPHKAEWMGGPQRGGVATGTVLVAAPAPVEYKSRNIVLIGVGRGGLPVEITAGSEPAWLATAATSPD
jgi:hypothetical protein